MIKRRKQLLGWACANFDKWPGLLDTNPDGADAAAVSAKWIIEPSLSVLPVLICRMGGTGPITSADWWYRNKAIIAAERRKSRQYEEDAQASAKSPPEEGYEVEETK